MSQSGESANTKHLKYVFEIIAVVFGSFGAVLGCLGYIAARDVEDIQQNIETNNYLDNAQSALNSRQELILPTEVTPNNLNIASRGIRDALEIDPSSQRAQLLEAIYISAGGKSIRDKTTTASKLFKKYIQSYPQDASGYDHYSRYLLEQGQCPEAIDVIERGLGLDPYSLSMKNSLGVCYLKIDQLEKARRTFQDICRESNFEYAPGLVNMALTLLAVGDFEGTEAFLMEAADLQPRDPEILRQLGAVKLANGKYKEAQTVLQDSLELEPPEVIRDLATTNLQQALWAMGKQSEAESIGTPLVEKRRRQDILRSRVKDPL